MNKNEPNALKRRTRVFMYEDDGVTPAPAATSFAAAGVVQVDIGAGWVNATGTFVNTGVDGDWIYTFTQAETNVDCNELAVKVVLAGYKVTVVAEDLADPADLVAAIMTYAHRAGRTILGFVRRLDAFAAGAAAGLKGATATFYQPDGVTEEFHAAQSTTNGTRAVPVVTGSET